MFAVEVRRLWAEIDGQRVGNYGNVVNKISGTATGHVAQARDVHGGISFGLPSAAPREPRP